MRVLFFAQTKDATGAAELEMKISGSLGVEEIWRALIGWSPTPEYTPIEYEGGDLLSINRNRVIYRFGFSAAFQLGRNAASDTAETWHELELDGLPGFTGATFNMDCIDPADPNLHRPGPDGRIEAKFSGDVTP